MKDLLSCNLREFTCKIKNVPVKGTIKVEDDEVFLCQDVKDGARCRDTLEYKYSWAVRDGSPGQLRRNYVSDFKLLKVSKKDIEEYKDWRIGDIISDGISTLEVIFISRELVICKNMSDKRATRPYTCDELYDSGFRLVVPEEDIEDFVEITIDEIARWKGVDPSLIKIKK